MAKALCERLDKLEGEISALLQTSRPCSCDERKRGKPSESIGSSKKPSQSRNNRSNSAPSPGSKRSSKQSSPRKNVNNVNVKKRDTRQGGSYPGSRSSTPENIRRKPPKDSIPPADIPVQKKNLSKIEPPMRTIMSPPDIIRNETSSLVSKRRPCACKPKCPNAPRGLPVTKVSSLHMAAAYNMCKCKLELDALQQLEEEKAKRKEAEALAKKLQKLLAKPDVIDEGTIPSDCCLVPEIDCGTCCETYTMHEDKSITTVESDDEMQRKLEYLENRNEYLRRSLEEEVRIRKSSLDDAKTDIKRTKKVLKEKVGKMQMKAIESAKKMADTNDKLAEAVKTRDEHLRKLSEVSETLAKEVRAKDGNCKAIRDENEILRVQLMEAREMNKRLEESNEKMAKSVKETYQRLETAKKEAEKLNKHIAQQKDESRKSQGEVERLKKKMYAKTDGNNIQRERDAMEKKIKEARERVRSSVEENDSQKLNMIKMQNEHIQERKKLEAEIQRLQEENKRLREKQQRLMEKVKNEESDLKKRNEVVEEKKDQLKSMAKSQKRQIEELTELNRKQEAMVQSHTTAIKSRDEQIRQKEAENELLRKKCESLEKSVEELRAAAETKEQWKASLQADLQKEIEAMSTELATAKNMVHDVEDQIARKQRVIDEQAIKINELQKESDRKSYELRKLREEAKTELDAAKKELTEIKKSQDESTKQELSELRKTQEETVKKQLAEMKKAEEEAKKAAEEFRKKNEELAKTIEKKEGPKKCRCPPKNASTETDNNQAIVNDIANINEENLRLEKQVEQLERTLQKLCRRSCAGDMEKRQLLITYLEQQVALQQKEWEIQKQVMAKEKTRALQAAHFATQKLLETVDDFQSQVDTQKRVQRMLAGMLQEKEERLRYVSSQMTRGICCPKRVSFGEIPKKEVREVREVCYKTVYNPVTSRSSIYSPYSPYIMQEEPASTESYQTVSSSGTSCHAYSRNNMQHPMPVNMRANRNNSQRFPPSTPPGPLKCRCSHSWR